MAHEGREGPRDDSYNGETYLRSADASQYHSSENEQVQRQSQSTAPPPSSSQYLGYAPWNAPLTHPGFQEARYERYAVPCANGTAPGNGAWYEAQQNCPVPPVPAMSASSKYTHQGAGPTGGAPPHHWDGGNPTGSACCYAPPVASNPQPNGMAGQGFTSVANIQSGAGGITAQNYNPGTIDAPVPSEFLGSLSRRLILDLGTHVKAFNVEPNGSGRLKVTITLDAADIV